MPASHLSADDNHTSSHGTVCRSSPPCSLLLHIAQFCLLLLEYPVYVYFYPSSVSLSLVPLLDDTCLMQACSRSHRGCPPVSHQTASRFHRRFQPLYHLSSLCSRRISPSSK